MNCIRFYQSFALIPLIFFPSALQFFFFSLSVSQRCLTCTLLSTVCLNPVHALSAALSSFESLERCHTSDVTNLMYTHTHTRFSHSIQTIFSVLKYDTMQPELLVLFCFVSNINSIFFPLFYRHKRLSPSPFSLSVPLASLLTIDFQHAHIRGMFCRVSLLFTFDRTSVDNSSKSCINKRVFRFNLNNLTINLICLYFLRCW